LRTSNVEGLGLYTQRNQFVSALQFNIFFPGERYILRWRNTYSYFPDMFWGYGNNTPDSAGERYDFRQVFIHPQLMRKIYRDFYVGVTYEMQHVFNFNYIPDGIFDQQHVTGRYGGTVSGLGLVFTWDSRNNAFSSTQGSYIQWQIVDFNNCIFSDFNYTSMLVDIRKYISMRRRDVWGFNLISHMTFGDVPIRNMAILGGQEIMRGYYEGRFTDNQMVAAQTEYRLHVWRRFGMVAFLGYGKVMRDWRSFSVKDLKYSYGAGIRYAINKKEKLNLRLDYGLGEHTQALYFGVSETF